jgi:hypothetical protein
VENYILNVKREHSSWGARKIRERLLRRFSGIPIPAKSTIHAVLDRHGFVELDLGSFGGTCTFASDLNNRGEVAGFSTLAGDQVEHAFSVEGSVVT